MLIPCLLISCHRSVKLSTERPSSHAERGRSATTGRRTAGSRTASRSGSMSVTRPPAAMESRPTMLVQLRVSPNQRKPTVIAVKQVEVEERRQHRGLGALVGGDRQEVADRRDGAERQRAA